MSDLLAQLRKYVCVLLNGLLGWKKEDIKWHGVFYNIFKGTKVSEAYEVFNYVVESKSFPNIMAYSNSGEYLALFTLLVKSVCELGIIVQWWR